MNIKNNHFSTDNFYLAVFLFAKGLELANIDRSNTRRCKFVFIDMPQRESLVEAYSFGKANCEDLKIDARALFSAIKVLKDRLYQS